MWQRGKYNENKKYSFIISIGIAVIVAAVGWALCRYYGIDADTNGNDVRTTIQQAERDNQSARDDINNAIGKINDATQQLDSAAGHIDGAAKRANELQDRARQDAATLDECQRLVEQSRRDAAEASGIFADIDRTNKAAGAQASSVAPST